MKKENIINKEFNEIIKKVILVLMTLIFFGMFLTKGAYFKEDAICFNFLLIISSVAFLGVNIYKIFKQKTNIKLKFLDMAVVIYSLSYLMPIIFKQTVALSDAIQMSIKYLGFACSYFAFKELFKENDRYIMLVANIFVIISTIFCIFGLDELSIKAFEPLLKQIGTSYASAEFRLSSIFQYANVSAIFIALSIFVTVYLALNVKKIYGKIIYISIVYLQFMCLLLTQSRTTIILFIVIATLLIWLIKDKFIRNKLFTMHTFTIVYSSIFFAVIYQFVKMQTRWQVILLFVISCAIYTFITTYMHLFMKEFKDIIRSKKYITIYTISIISVIVILAIIVFSLKTSLLVTDEVKRKVKINTIDNLNINVELASLEKCKDIDININLLDKNHNIISQEHLDKTNVVNNKINKQITKNNKIKYVEFELNVIEGSYIIDNINVNKKNLTLEYVLLPYDLVSKVQDVFIGSSSFAERLTYYKDGLNFSKNNLLVGTGGQTFRNAYQSFQSRPYISSESHSYPLDILLNTGLIGLLSYLTIIIYVGYKISKKIKLENNLKSIVLFGMFILLILHSIIDLDFSYNIILFIFSAILALIEDDKVIYEVKNNYIVIIVASVVIIAYAFVSTKIFIANSIYLSVKDNEKISLEDMVNKIKVARVLNKYDLDIQIEEININEKYKIELKTKLKENNVNKNIFSEIENVLDRLKNTSNDMSKYNPYNKKAYEEIAKVYIRNFMNFAQFSNDDDYNKELEPSFNVIDKIVSVGELNSNNYHIAVMLWNSIYTQLSQIQKQDPSFGLNKSIDKAIFKIQNIENTIKENFKKHNLIYNESFIESFSNIIKRASQN